MKKILVVIGSRANYGTSKSILTYIKKSTHSSLIIVASASSVLDKFGDVSELMEQDGFTVNYRLFNFVDGNALVTMPKSVGMNLIDLSNIFSHEHPDIVVTIGDRFETIATAIAAAYQNIPLAHVMGGEVSGSIDESVRHSITKLAHLHFPATEISATRISKMGEDRKTIFNFGCPRIDEVKSTLENPPSLEFLNHELNSLGVGSNVDLNLPFILLNYHPVTSEIDKTLAQVKVLLNALDEIKIQVLGLWPNSDAGYEIISQQFRIWQKQSIKNYSIRLFKNLPVCTYFHLMALAACQVGNSSSALREGSFIGNPAVNIGSRQSGRECANNVMFVDFNMKTIINAVKSQINHGKYVRSTIFGDGNAGNQIAETLLKMQVSTQKKLSY